MTGYVTQMSAKDAKTCSQIAPDYDVDDNGLILFCPRSTGSSEVHKEMIQLVVPESSPQAFLHHYHTTLEGATKGSEELISGSEPIFH